MTFDGMNPRLAKAEAGNSKTPSPLRGERVGVRGGYVS